MLRTTSKSPHGSYTRSRNSVITSGSTTASGKLVFGIFAALAAFERELIRERTMAGLQAVRASDRKGGRKFGLTKVQVLCSAEIRSASISA